MARGKTFYNVSGGRLILPNGEDIGPEGVELDKDTLANAGVQSWIEDGLLSVDMPKTAVADLATEVARLTAEVARLTGEVAERDATIAKLTADLEAATKPPASAA